MARNRARSGRSPRTAPAPTGSTATPAVTRVLRRRVWSVAATWLLILVFFVGPLLLGNLLFLLPVIAFSIATVATMRLARSPEGPDAETLAPGALKAATVDRPVVVHGTWSAGGAGRGDAGVLQFANRRIAFVTTDGEATFEAPANKLRLVSVPGFWRPQLDLEIDGVTHTVRFFPLWDLGATVVGPVVAGEWYAQLRALGAR